MIVSQSVASTKHYHLLRSARNTRVRLEYLPPYSPDLNPIELSFNELKSWIKRERDLSYEFGIWFEGFIAVALRSVVTEDTTRGYFQHCGVFLPDETRDIHYSEL